MWHELLSNTSFFELLIHVDEDLAEQSRSAGCVHCGGRLDRAPYPRKPRGVPRALRTAYGSRLSFCCAREGCRLRCTPPSVRFLGRRVYPGVVVVLLSALQSGVDGKRAALLREHLGVDRRTVQRWCQWWREVFPLTAFWRAVQARFVPALAPTALPAQLCERFAVADQPDPWVRLLRFVSPLSTGSASRHASC